jgi:MFS family permease
MSAGVPPSSCRPCCAWRRARSSCAYAAETESPARRKGRAPVHLSPRMMARLFLVMTFAAISSSLLFNFTTNGNGQLMRERFEGIVEDPARLGIMLAGVYAVASLAQVVVGRLIDRYPLKRLYLGIVLLQVPMFLLAAHAQGWALFGCRSASWWRSSARFPSPTR